MRHMIRSFRALTQILPRTRNAVPPNIFFSSSRRVRLSAARTRSTRSARSTDRLRLFGERRAVEVDVERANPAVANFEDFGDVAPERRALWRLELIARQRAG